MTVNLDRLTDILDEAYDLAESLNGRSLDETGAIHNKGPGREQRARMSQELQLLASRLELGAALARHEYWAARGHTDHLTTTRSN